LKINEEAMLRNLFLTEGAILAEPTYIALALSGHVNAHEYLKRLTALEGKSFEEILKDDVVREAIEKLPKEKQQIFNNMTKYIGRSERLVDKITNYWEKRVKELVM